MSCRTAPTAASGRRAREDYSLMPAEVASPLRRRPYDLRHAAVSTWLNGGVPALQVAGRGKVIAWQSSDSARSSAPRYPKDAEPRRSQGGPTALAPPRRQDEPQAVLQIASGMYFRPVPLHETVHRATLYTNAERLEPDAVELPIARLLFSTSLAHVSSVTVEVVDRLESERPDGQPEFMVATSGRELVADVATVLAFALNVTCSTDVDLVRRLVPEQLDRRPAAGAPSNILRRTFDPNIMLKATDFVDVHDFCTRLLALQRSKFVAAMRAIRRVVDATVLIADDVSLAYTLYVAALESLAQGAPGAPSTWESFDAHKRQLIDTACEGLTNEQIARVRTAVLEIEQLSLRRKFQAFTLDHVDRSYYRAEAVGASRPISAASLPRALDFAYKVRSRNVHALKQLEPEMWVMSDRAETIEFEGRTRLRLEGLNRLCRHVIRQFVYRAPTDLDRLFAVSSGLLSVRPCRRAWGW